MVEVTETRDLSRLRVVVQSRFLFYAGCQEWQQKQKADETGLAFLVELQCGDTLKISVVASNERQIVLNSRCSNEEIRLVNQLAFASQIATNAGIAFGNGATNAKHWCHLQKYTPAFFIVAPPLPIVDTFVDFGKGDNADAYPFRNKPFEQRKHV
jgi:hypothetical protein